MGILVPSFSPASRLVFISPKDKTSAQQRTEQRCSLVKVQPKHRHNQRSRHRGALYVATQHLFIGCSMTEWEQRKNIQGKYNKWNKNQARHSGWTVLRAKYEMILSIRTTSPLRYGIVGIATTRHVSDSRFRFNFVQCERIECLKSDMYRMKRRFKYDTFKLNLWLMRSVRFAVCVFLSSWHIVFGSAFRHTNIVQSMRATPLLFARLPVTVGSSAVFGCELWLCVMRASNGHGWLSERWYNRCRLWRACGVHHYPDTQTQWAQNALATAQCVSSSPINYAPSFIACNRRWQWT